MAYPCIEQQKAGNLLEHNPRVTIAVCTYKRPEMIVKCLRSLFVQRTDFAYDIVVVENDVEQGSRGVIEALIPEAAENGIDLRYYCEPEQSIAAARNRCAAQCRGEFLAFFDDDQWAEEDWLQMLVEAQRETDADVVNGVISPVFEEGFPEYLKDEFYDKVAIPERGRIIIGGTGSMLIRAEALQLREMPFDLKYGRTGGEDVDFYLFLNSQRKKAIKTFLAKAYEYEPVEKRGKMYYSWERRFRGNRNIAEFRRKYFYRAAGTYANARHFFISAWRCLKVSPYLLWKPRWAIFTMGCHVAACLGIIAFYLGIKKTGYH